MLHILGLGSAFPQNKLTTAVLTELGLQQAANYEKETGVKSRYTCLSSEYLAATKNSDPRQALIGSSESANDIAVKAAREAIAAAGISPEQIGCIIGDNPTPAQSTPGEGQRVGDKLGLKIPAYDVSGGGVMPLHLSLISRWKIERIPEYLLLIAAAAPTLRIDYATGQEGLVLGDGAVAAVVSAKHRGKFKVIEAFSKSIIPRKNAAFFSQYAPASVHVPEFVEQIEALTQEMVGQAIFRNKLKPQNIKLALSQHSPACSERMANALSVPMTALLDFTAETGNILSIGALSVVARSAPTLKTGDIVVCAQVNTGLTAGYAVLEVL